MCYFKALGCSTYLLIAGKYTEPRTPDLKHRLNVFVEVTGVLILLVSPYSKERNITSLLKCFSPSSKRKDLKQEKKPLGEVPYTQTLA